ncbi:TetR/AcrR family transcriptional regulator [Cellulomonas sp. 179-A 9B4 NHS]|uniref:TetR/AcrR family transcriptional regulator n=1 Tax=Cellulomonas sp. 179-A 9B4 NHS TaxID=3142379 RepID=UPI00399FB1F6
MIRPRSVSDDDLLARIDAGLSQRADPTPWSLQDAAVHAGMSPAGLVKRFGSKEGLLLALARRWVALVPTDRTSDDDPADELRRYVRASFDAPSSPAAVVALGELMRDLWSPASAELLRQGWARQAAYVETLLRHVPLAAHVDAHAAALTVLDALHGALYRRAVDLEPTPPDRILDTLLEAWT